MTSTSKDRHILEGLMILVGVIMLIIGGVLSGGPTGPTHKLEYIGKTLKDESNEELFPEWATRRDRYIDHDIERVIVKESGGRGPAFREVYYFEDDKEPLDPTEFSENYADRYTRIDGRGPLVNTDAKMVFWIGLAISCVFGIIILPIDMRVFPE
jgi:hypothetical protein